MSVDDKKQGIRALEYLIGVSMSEELDWTLNADQIRSRSTRLRQIIVAAANVVLCGQPVQKRLFVESL